MNSTSTIGFIQIEIRNFDSLLLCKVSNGIEKMFELNSNDYIGKSFQECFSIESNFSRFLLKELEHSYKSLISHSESFNFETSFVDTTLQQKYLCHLTLHPLNEESVQLFDVTVINVSVQSKNIFILEEILERTSTVVGQDFFDSVVMLFHDFFGVTASYIGFFTESNTKNYLYSFAKNGELTNGLEIELIGTPCELVLQQGEVTIETDIEKYVQPPLIPLTFKREAFIGQPITNNFGEKVGLIGIQHETKIQDTSLIRSIMRILAPRTFAEHSRLLAYNLLIDKNRYYQYILDHVSSHIIATNSDGIIQNVTNSVSTLLGLPIHQIVGNSIGEIFTLDKQQFEHSIFFKILTSNIHTPIVTTVFTKNPSISELIFETREFLFETGKKEYIFTVSEKNHSHIEPQEIKELEYFVREAKILELRTILLELQQSQTKNPLDNIDNCLRSVSKALSLEYSGYWSMIENAMKCERFFEVLESKFNIHLEGFTLNENDYGEYLQYFRSLKEPSIIYDVYTNPITKVFKNYFIQFGIETMVEIPIWINGELKGMFCVEGKDATRRFEEYEIAFLSAVSLIISQGLQQSISTTYTPKINQLQEKVLNAFHSIHLPFIIIDRKSLVIIDVNESWANTFNYHKDAIIGLSLNDINFFRYWDSNNTLDVDAMFSSEVALNQTSFIFLDNNSSKTEFLITSTLFTVEDSELSLFCFQSVPRKEVHPKNDISLENNSQNFQENQDQNILSKNFIEYTFEELSEQILSKFSNEIDSKKLSFSVYVDERMKNVVVSNVDSLRTIVEEALNNAIENTSTGFVSVSFINKQNVEKEDSIVVEVKDSGIGMNEEQVTSIINSFSQYGIEKNSGFFRIRDLVASFEGTISIESTPNKGTTLIIEIPSSYNFTDEQIPQYEKVDATTIQYPENTISIQDKMFLIQKNATLDSENLEKLFSHYGALNYFTHSFDETKEVSKLIHFACMILLLDKWNDDDVSLLETIQEQSINSSTPIIVISSSTDEDTSKLQSIAIEILPYSNSIEYLLETLEILFPIETNVTIDNL